MDPGGVGASLDPGYWLGQSRGRRPPGPHPSAVRPCWRHARGRRAAAHPEAATSASRPGAYVPSVWVSYHHPSAAQMHVHVYDQGSLGTGVNRFWSTWSRQPLADCDSLTMPSRGHALVALSAKMRRAADASNGRQTRSTDPKRSASAEPSAQTAVCPARATAPSQPPLRCTANLSTHWCASLVWLRSLQSARASPRWCR